MKVQKSSTNLIFHWLKAERGDNIEEQLNPFTFPAIVKSQIAIGSRKKYPNMEL